MQLSKRLKAVADMISSGKRVADIGCDHAYVSIYLMENQIASKVIAMDVNKGPLKKAKENISNHGLNNYIETRLSDGGKMLQINEVDTILIAGMGGALMVKILSDSKEAVASCDELVLQPQSESFLVRQYVEKIGYHIIDENMIIEDDKYYVIIKARKTTILNPYRVNESKEVYDRYGRILLEKKNAVLKQYLIAGIEKNCALMTQLLKSNSIKGKYRIDELKIDLEYIKEGLSYYEM